MTAKPIETETSGLKETVLQLPKSDLHLHLDGSLRLPTLIELAREMKFDLPSQTVEGLQETLFKDSYASLEEYLTTFYYSCAVMQTPEQLERIAFELAEDCQAEGVRYIEVRYAPQLHINANMDVREVLLSVNRGLLKAQTEFNHRPEVKTGQEPPFHYGIIACALRNFGPFSPYFKKFIAVHEFSSLKSAGKLASLELAKSAVHVRNETGIPIVGFDLAGAEAGYPAADHRRAFQYAHEAFLHKSVHAGEAYGPESIFQAITELHADRIGHGYLIFDTSRIESERIIDKEKYVRNLCRYVADQRITIEVCLTSNMQTNPELHDLTRHTFGRMLAEGLSTTFCTDNRTVSKTSMTKEIMTALNTFPITPRELRNCVINGFKRSFFPGPYVDKRKFVRQCIDYYDQVAATHAQLT
ncbi:adenosine deaminase family protein [Desulfobacterales bacterium HSG17]|nr:adenosine deaminase family protein [Desulfobacterales bacterium HSG17]